MDRLLIVSNRLPFTIQVKNKEQLDIRPSVGGLATGMRSIYKKYDSRWFGWPGLDKKELTKNSRSNLENYLSKENCLPVYIDKKDLNLYYSGFSNKVIWPLFHYFMQFAEYEDEYWDAYVRVNEKFANEILQHVEKGDKIWIHDYHLLLAPKMIRDQFPDITIGFFLHIPFPSFELFRVLPWREQILEGMLGADLVGFHTYDYERHFLSSVRRLFGYETYFNQIKLGNRIVKVDAFPMGIDYDRFHNASEKSKHQQLTSNTDIKKEIDRFYDENPNRKLILSIDRLDYSKGIPNRLMAFEYFLDCYPEYREKVSLVMLSVPSRVNVEQYQLMKSEIDELVGRINGKYATINWSPVWYFYRSLPFENLIELYNSCEVALITPVRDGMNLVAKEYLAARTDGSGVLILSEMAGAFKELNEALIINPNNKKNVADTIKKALEMPVEEQRENNIPMQERIKRYDIKRWASDFINSLANMQKVQTKYVSKKITPAIENGIINAYKTAMKKVFFIDYDGALISYDKNMQKAILDSELYEILDALSETKDTDVVIITGRKKEILDKWFPSGDYTLIAEHGVWKKEKQKSWENMWNGSIKNDWKSLVMPVIQFYTDRTPGSFVEEKTHSVSWFYRKTDPDLGASRVTELKDELNSLILNLNLEITEGNKMLEIKNSSINKGKIAMDMIEKHQHDFVMAIGGDYTNESLYRDLPYSAITIRAGMNNTLAKYNLESFKEVRNLLKKMAVVHEHLILE